MRWVLIDTRLPACAIEVIEVDVQKSGLRESSIILINVASNIHCLTFGIF